MQRQTFVACHSWKNIQFKNAFYKPSAQQAHTAEEHQKKSGDPSWWANRQSDWEPAPSSRKNSTSILNEKLDKFFPC
jgi:hypothetical protein